MSEYRKEVNGVEKEVPFIIWKIVKWGIPLLVVVLLLGFGLQSTGIVSMNINREIVQHSQQYVETKINLLNKLHADWYELDTDITELRVGGGNEELIAAKKAQQKNSTKRILTEAGMIPSFQLPENIKIFVTKNQIGN